MLHNAKAKREKHYNSSSGATRGSEVDRPMQGRSSRRRKIVLQ